ncbi:ABC transporter permease [Fluviicola taffensis]|uniref:ABC-2 type transporter n=1 Tax=Fluviicola taffensis (strain DSM 16823 / NCIMB 13979 / RW262) TaxID=755732 RepID=F2ICL4_FLUTR|nr:ABC transporter permease [Fluviicola taffensis]AEA42241.1 ABC-2 type transporter [Fluviicola taffensis DSM 16823]
MRNSWIIALRELKERMSSRSFVLMAILGPLVVLTFTYLVFQFGGNEQQKWHVLVVDPANVMEQKIRAQEDPNIEYSFATNYVEIEQFAQDKRFAPFDAMVEINEKILSNKACFLFYREKPSFNMSINVRYQVERRLEEVLAKEFTKLSVSDFRKIKQPLNLAFRNVYDPKDETGDLSGWVGLFFGTVIFIFIFLFGMTILRSVSREKTNRVVEILLATVKPRSLMLGKILGIGLSAFIQVFLWILIIGFGLYFMRETVFVDIYDASNQIEGQMSDYNQFVELVFDRVNFGVMLFYFGLFFTFGYLFYGAFFAALGATSGSESDGQQFLIPLILILCFALYAGYFALENPDSNWTTFLLYFPFTAPVVAMVKLSIGFVEGNSYQLFVSMIMLLLSAVGVIAIAARLFKNGLLQFGHTLRFRDLIRWLKTK